MFCWYCRSTLKMDWELMELCKSVERKREVGIKGDCWDESAGWRWYYVRIGVN